MFITSPLEAHSRPSLRYRLWDSTMTACSVCEETADGYTAAGGSMHFIPRRLPVSPLSNIDHVDPIEWLATSECLPDVIPEAWENETILASA